MLKHLSINIDKLIRAISSHERFKSNYEIFSYRKEIRRFDIFYYYITLQITTKIIMFLRLYLSLKLFYVVNGITINCIRFVTIETIFSFDLMTKGVCILNPLILIVDTI